MIGAQAQPADSEGRIVFSRALPDDGVNTYSANPDGTDETACSVALPERRLRSRRLVAISRTKLSAGAAGGVGSPRAAPLAVTAAERLTERTEHLRVGGTRGVPLIVAFTNALAAS